LLRGPAGQTWSRIVRLAGNVSNLMAIGGTDYTNNAVIKIKAPKPSSFESSGGGGEVLLYQLGTQNNPSLQAHGRILQRLSSDGSRSLLPCSLPALAPAAQSAVRPSMDHSTDRCLCRWGDLEHPD
jgi:hypothetical protein